ncbi:sorbosone dehydrogenase family protein [Nocardioides sp.]|uniref:PQQ-dependent sugar dehydrogenase n=1 Tax=Nocardioides sp. TaxID=35761 RepID=UPI003527EEA4
MTPRLPLLRPLARGRTARRLVVPATVLAASVALLPAPAHAAHLPSGFRQSTIATGLVAPIDLEVAPDGRVFVAEQAGRVRVLRKDGKLVTFLTLGNRVDHTDERGLSGIALDPSFETNGYVYLDYTRKATATVGAHNEVIRVTAQGNKAVAGSEKRLFRLDRQRSTHHVGGALEFGPDGKLYITSGDSQHGASAPQLTSLLGKVLRINRKGSIPKSNPFYDRASGRKRAIWARGLRNPFKLSSDGTRLFVNDVGEQAWEEIDQVRKGRHYGWPAKEGPESVPAYTPPVFAYQHGTGNKRGCAITGGVFYTPPADAAGAFPSGMAGDYFFADLCRGWIRRYDVASGTARAFATDFPTRQLVDLEVAPNGSLLVLRLNGKITRIRHTG